MGRRPCLSALLAVAVLLAAAAGLQAGSVRSAGARPAAAGLPAALPFSVSSLAPLSAPQLSPAELLTPSPTLGIQAIQALSVIPAPAAPAAEIAQTPSLLPAADAADRRNLDDAAAASRELFDQAAPASAEETAVLIPEPSAQPPLPTFSVLPKDNPADALLAQAEQPAVAVVDMTGLFAGLGIRSTDRAHELNAALGPALRAAAEARGATIGRIKPEIFCLLGEADALERLLPEIKQPSMGSALASFIERNGYDKNWPAVKFGLAPAAGLPFVQALAQASKNVFASHDNLPPPSGRTDRLSEIFNEGIYGPTGWLRRVLKKLAPADPAALRGAVGRAMERGADAESAARGLLDRIGREDEGAPLSPRQRHVISRKLEPLRTAYREVIGRIDAAGLSADEARPWLPQSTRALLDNAIGLLDKVLQPTSPFLSSGEAQELVLKAARAAERHLSALKARLAAKARPALSEEREQDVFLALLYRELFPGRGATGRGGIAILDNDAGLSELPLERTRGIIIDHHGRHFQTLRPEKNTTSLLLDRIESLLAGPGTPKRKLERLKRDFAKFSTNNLGDGAWSVWILSHLERIVSDPTLRRRIRLATHFEDFGFFGRRAYKLAAGRPERAAAIELQRAVFKTYDEALRDISVRDSDRFDVLTPEQQLALLDRVLGEMTRALDDPAFRARQAAAFAAEVEALVPEVRRARLTLSEEDRALLAEEGVDPQALGQVFIYDEGRVKGGVFARWGAATLAHGRSLQMSFKALSDDRISFILAVPNGETAPNLQPVGTAIAAADAKKADALGVPQKERGAVFGRSNLQVAFKPGLLLTPRELLLETARAWAKL